jgi:hypothetical protein
MPPLLVVVSWKITCASLADRFDIGGGRLLIQPDIVQPDGSVRSEVSEVSAGVGSRIARMESPI